MTPNHVARQLIARCDAGFKSEWEWMGWRKKHSAEIKALPVGLRKQVLTAWEQATSVEFSR